MNEYASVIVDVKARQTDRPFDYKIPDQWIGSIQPGMRVIVPFGPRNIQGFVESVKNSSSVEHPKNIHTVLDLTPVLNEELLSLGSWLTEESVCFKIQSYQVMLPAALKASYEKEFELHIEETKLPLPLQTFFLGRKRVKWKEAEEEQLLPLLQREVKYGHVELHYMVKQKNQKKMEKYILLNTDDPTEIKDQLPTKAYKQQQIVDVFIQENLKELPWKELMEKANVSSSSLKSLIEKGILKEEKREVYRDPFAHRDFVPSKPFPLTNEQAKAIHPILQSIKDNRHEAFLLYGVTGSGKTEVYLQSISRVLEEGKEAIMLVPEISLTPQMVTRFKSRFGNKVAVLHSGLSAGEKYDEWRKIQRKEVSVVVGARSAIFAPFGNLGIIIIDEEHETSYKQEENPRYHARDVAMKRGDFHQCPVVLGSATPSLETFARAKKNVYTLLTLPLRMNGGALPSVSIVDMREELREGNRSMFSVELFEKLQLRMEKKEQSVLFLNKRGYSSFVMCRDCGFVLQCPHCDISLTYHRHSNSMKCHYCSYEESVPTTCPECHNEHIRYFGTGTQKVEEELIKLLPGVKIIRMDVDTTSKKGSHERLLGQFEKGDADILLGTQMIAKGLDFPNITLVGVLSADTMLHLPDFRASEKTFQLLTQVSGRAGRHRLPGEVVIQTYTPEHYSIELAGEQNYDDFYQKEMMIRKMGGYPPFYYMVLVTVSHEDLMKVVGVTERVTKFLSSKLTGSSVILGPTASPVPRIKNRYRYQCLLKYKREPELVNHLHALLEYYKEEMNRTGLIISIDRNPYMMM
ncbi:primosomal protein N' [Bacillus coahuilensis p1.1.43]|uniref:Replication restart protein PriA n=1 Tax=Bacillus coahuilensis p1.1.43 TaxID=1150625 RepID=A0A147K9G9_9BACI|nr:primosomal protein N' [Bacillus coahuilensis]KUP07060.1 primosomal protein N' [Bacillus coahuilensis p1.1.43]